MLGIETTCDETAAAVVERSADGRGAILSNVVLSQIEEHAAFGGVVPEIAARAHVEALDIIIATAMREAGRSFADLDGVAAAAGPGLIGGVIVGLTTAKAIALVCEKPLLAVNHLEAHALTARLTDGTPFPYCLFLASGGHTQIVAVRGVGDYVRLGTTRDDAIGEAFDKTAKLIGFGYPGGPKVEREAARGDRGRFLLAAADERAAGRRFLALRPQDGGAARGREDRAAVRPDVADLAASFQLAVVEMVTDRLRNGLRMFRERFGRADRTGRGRRRRRQPGDPRCAARCRSAEPGTAGGAAAGVVHRQCGDDRLGGRRAARPWPARSARREPAGALAARSARRGLPPPRAGEGRGGEAAASSGQTQQPPPQPSPASGRGS